MQKIRIALIIFFINCGLLIAQTDGFKHEKEIRIKRGQFPPAALQQLEQLSNDVGKLKFFKEYGFDKVSYEVKFVWEKNRWSLEFDADGRFMDIERTLTNKEIRNKKIGIFAEALASIGEKPKVLSAQQQFSWVLAERNHFDKNMVKPGHKGVLVRYELEVETKTSDGLITAFELLLDEDGQLLQKRLIIPPSDVHLIH